MIRLIKIRGRCASPLDNPHCRTRVNQAGFTLIELVIIILIIGILSFFAMPRFDQNGPKVSAVAKKLVEDLRYVQNRAVTTQLGHRMAFVNCVAGCTQYQVLQFDPLTGLWTPARDTLGGQSPANNGVFVVDMSREFAGVTLTLNGTLIGFDSSGTPNAGLDGGGAPIPLTGANNTIDVQAGTVCERVAITLATGLISQTDCP